MKNTLYSVFDTVSSIFNKPFTHVNDASAIRDFSTGLSDNPNKNDYVLYKISEFDDNNGQLTPLKTPVKIFTGFDIKLPEMLKQQSGE